MLVSAITSPFAQPDINRQAQASARNDANEKPKISSAGASEGPKAEKAAVEPNPFLKAATEIPEAAKNLKANIARTVVEGQSDALEKRTELAATSEEAREALIDSLDLEATPKGLEMLSQIAADAARSAYGDSGSVRSVAELADADDPVKQTKALAQLAQKAVQGFAEAKQAYDTAPPKTAIELVR